MNSGRNRMIKTCGAILAPAILVGASVMPMNHARGAVDPASSPTGAMASFDELTPGNFTDEIAEAFGLASYDLVHVDVPAQRGEAFSVILPIDGEPVMVDFEPYSNRSEHFRVLAQTGPDTYEEVEPTPLHTLRGSVHGVPMSGASGSLTSTGLKAQVVFPDGTTRWLQPVADRFADAPGDLYVVFGPSDILHAGVCGVGLIDIPGQGQGLHAGHNHTQSQQVGFLGADGFGTDGLGVPPTEQSCAAEIAIDADYEYFTRWFNSVPGVQERVESIINDVNFQYERQVGITHEITTILVRTTVDDPYSSTTNAGTLLGEVETQWVNNHGDIPRDVMQLFTFRPLADGVLGVAFLSSVCEANGFSLVRELNSSNWAFVTDLTAHELGHTWGADHCMCGSNTMNAGLTGTNFFNPTETVPEIIAFRNSRTCLDCFPGGEWELSSVDVRRGTVRSGDLSSIEVSDDVWLRIDSEERNGRNLTAAVISGRLPTAEPGALEVLLELGVAGGNPVTVIKMWNFDEQRWERVERFSQPRPDIDVPILIDDNPGRFVGGPVNQIQIMVLMRDGNDDFRSRIDFAFVRAVPQDPIP